AGRVALPVKIRERREFAPPQRDRENETHQEQAGGVAEGVGGAVREPAFVDATRRADAGFRAEPRGEDREGRETGTEPAAGEQVVGFAAALGAPPDDEHDEELNGDVTDDPEESGAHGASVRAKSAQATNPMLIKRIGDAMQLLCAPRGIAEHFFAA